MKILISGASGLLGSALVPRLQQEGWSVSRLVRHNAHGADEIEWNPASETLDPRTLQGFDAVVHLAGEPVATRWTAKKKFQIRDSRVSSTQLLSRALAQLDNPPRFFGCASAIGFYGERGDEVVTEESSNGSGFLAEVCRDWESATIPAQQAGIRVANFRIGVVLSPDGGALKAMLPPFRMGLGGKVGNGKQWFSWIAIEDIVGAMMFVLQNKSVSGPVNLVAPNAVTNQEFVRTLGKVLSRPVLFSVPAPLLKLVAREEADEMLLISQRVQPKVLCDHGYVFQFPDLENTLSALL
jgi:uncharacterized protein (TIGR01777 family)